MLRDIQGLRAVAVTFVILFHLWPTTFEAGFLGVDMFFVISGFLMHKILSSKPCNIPTVVDFYFRRFRRILPTYLFILLITTVAAHFLFIPSQYPTVLRELIAAVTLTSNLFSLPDQGYFDHNNAYPLFLHTWSLSVELQFYVVVPVIFWIYSNFNRWRRSAGVGFIVALITISLGFQLLFREDVNISHMNTLSRIWQFMCGFLTDALKPAIVLPKKSMEACPESAELMESKDPMQLLKNIYKRNAHFKKRLLNILLIIQLAIRLTEHIWINRILCTATTSIFIFVNGKSFIENGVFVFIGDISYSIYLTHWPIIIFARYLGVDEVSDGILMVQMFVLLSYLVENAFCQLSKQIQTWRKLLSSLVLLYLLILTISYQMAIVTERSSLPGKLPVSKDLDFYSKSERLFEKRNENISATEAVALNDESIKFINTFTVEHTVNNERRDHHRTYFDQVEGNGTKEIVVIGNSLARDLYFGVRSRMRNVYKRLTLFYISGILPFQNNPRRHTSPKDFTDFVKKMNCTIDVLITGQAYKAVTVPPDDDYIRSQMLGDIQTYYDQLAGLDVKLLVIPYAEHVIDFTIEKYNQAVLLGTQSQLNYKHAQVHNLHTEAINKIIDRLKCKNCVKIDFFNSLCDPVEDRCYVGQENGLAIYRDKAHTTIFGSIYFADALLNGLKLSRVVK